MADPARTAIETEAAANVDADDLARFAATAARWWDETGPAAPLHKLNPARLDFLREVAIRHFGRDPRQLRPFAGLDAVDVGCGGGLVSEPLARMGFSVLGIDADARAIAVARRHAALMGLEERVSYLVATAEELAGRERRFALVCCLELVEHVPQPRRLIADLVRLARPGGLILLSTLNRTARSFLEAIVGAEWLLGWVPRGTHDWNRFLAPAELAGWLEEEGCRLVGQAGVAYDPCRDRFALSGDMQVNYLLAAAKEGG